jgi:hypothetical protein
MDPEPSPGQTWNQNTRTAVQIYCIVFILLLLLYCIIGTVFILLLLYCSIYQRETKLGEELRGGGSTKTADFLCVNKFEMPLDRIYSQHFLLIYFVTLFISSDKIRNQLLLYGRFP